MRVTIQHVAESLPGLSGEREIVMFKNVRNAAVGAGVALVAGAASAEVPAGVTTAITAGGADAALTAGAVLAALAGFKLIMWIRSVLR